jgi:hypothetical protein
MDTRFFIIIAASSFGLMVLSAIVGNVLESMGVLTKENIGRTGTVIVLSFYFTLFCILAFSLVPVLLKAFVAMQVRIGNGEHALIRWVREHERGTVFTVWGLFTAGLLIAFTLARQDILKQVR